MKNRLLLLFVAFTVFNSSTFSTPSEGKKAQTQKLHQGALGTAFSQAKFDAYKASLPRDGGYFIIEGDWLLSDAELLEYVASKIEPGKQEKQTAANSELLINVLSTGKRDYYEDVNQRVLTYAVDRLSFASADQYDLIASNIKLAGKEWQDACSDCRIKFVYMDKFDGSPSIDKVNFIVRFHDVHGAYIAASFFPHDVPLRRFLNIDPSYFQTNFDRVGVLRHELGHVLGYRHEHIQGIAGCYNEDNQWQPLTPYDPQSVMHYYCGGAGSLMLRLTESDKIGHRQLYTVTN